MIPLLDKANLQMPRAWPFPWIPREWLLARYPEDFIYHGTRGSLIQCWGVGHLLQNIWWNELVMTRADIPEVKLGILSLRGKFTSIGYAESVWPTALSPRPPNADDRIARDTYLFIL